MCTETFLRLPEEKRARFLSAAWEAFTSARFADVSINQIIRKAGIPRGSFYQYFTGKEDLFSYLLELVRDHVRKLYLDALAETGGDIFQTQLHCFDSLTSLQGLTRDPILKRCVQFLRNNQGLDIPSLVPGQPGRRLLDGIWEHLDLSQFRRRDPEYVFHIFALLMAALGSAFMDTLCCAVDRETSRKALATQLEIIKHGCITPAESPAAPAGSSIHS